MSKFIPILFRQLWYGCLFLLLTVSCQQDDVEIFPDPTTPSDKETATMTFTLNIPDFREAKTRAGVQEKVIDNITVLIFANEGGTEKVKVKHVVPYTSLKSITGVSDAYSFSIPVTGGIYTRVALVANAETELNSIVVGSTYAALQNLEAIDKPGQKDSSVPYSYIPMYGEYAPAGGFELKAGLSQTIAQEISLIRMLARVDIVNNAATSGATTIGEVYFVNAAKNGRIWVNPAAYNTGSGYAVPTLPATLQRAGGLDFAYMGVGSSTQSEVLTYYLNEHPATSSAITTYAYTNPCIVMILGYKDLNNPKLSGQYYYRLNYTWDGVKPGGTKGSYMPVLRNHRYIFTIKEVKGPGFTSIKEALESPEDHTNRTNITVTTTVIDEAYTDVTFNNHGDYLAVTRTSFTLKGKHDATSTENRLSIRTNYPKGWKITLSGVPYYNQWLSCSQMNGAANTVANVQILTTGIGFGSADIEVRAGRLATKVEVDQINKVPLAYVAEYNLTGGTQYSTRPFSPTGAQNETNLRFATSHQTNQSGYFNWYVCTGESHPTYNPGGNKKLFTDAFFTTGAGKGHHLPSYWEWTGIFSYKFNAAYGHSTNTLSITNPQQQSNEAVDIGGVKNTFKSDYYSTGNGIGYALRFQKATYRPNDADVTMADFPLAMDNSALCAFRYSRVGGTFTTEGVFNRYLEVRCVHIGARVPMPHLQNDIAQESWWTAQAAIPGRVVTRIFPIGGFIPLAVPNMVVSNPPTSVGIYGDYWSKTPRNGYPGAWHAVLDNTHAMAHNYNQANNAYYVRVFSDN